VVIARQLVIPAHRTVELNKWGSFLVIKGLPPDKCDGHRLTLTLDFEKSGKVTVPLTCSPMARPHPAKRSTP